MKKAKYSEEQILSILKEEKEVKDIPKICMKHKIHYTTFYRWKNKYGKSNKKTRNNVLTFKLNDEEKKALELKCKAMGYENDVSFYIRKILFSKHISSGNPKEIIKELYKARGEVNKIGSNINQIANYTNFLLNQGYVENQYLKDFVDEVKKISFALTEQKRHIDQILIKI